jgi:dihydrofolate synthase/folylpolyglutamate synthase
MSHRAYLFSLEHVGIKLGLDQIRALVGDLGHPELAFQSIVVAGTNGKGSVTAMIERGLRAAGRRTGRYTSPHLVRIEERFAVDGEPISSEVFESAAGRVRAAAGALPSPPSFFEATTALAFEVFRDAGVEIAVLEVGLGGRLDATNVVDAAAVVITAVDFDHQEFLGNTLEQIAGEKAGVVKPGSLVVLAENPQVVEDVVRRRCADVGATLVRAADGVSAIAVMRDGRIQLRLDTPRSRYDPMTMALRGRHQVANVTAAVRLLEELPARMGVAVPVSAVRAAVEDVVWPGRLEPATWRGHDVLVDGAHNPAGARALQAYLAEAYGRRVPIVVGLMRDKDVAGVLGALGPAASHFICTAAATARAAAPSDLVAVSSRISPAIPAEAIDRPLDALARAVTYGAPAVVAGSLYLAGEIRAEWT